MIFYVIIIFLSDVTKISEHFLKIKFEFVPIILALEFLAFFVRSLRQGQFLKAIGIRIGLKENVKLFLSGYSMVITPGGAGELIKSQFLKKKFGEPRSKTFPIVILERYHDLVAIVIIILFTFLVIQKWQSLTLVVFTIILLISIFIIMRNSTLFTKLQQKLSKISFFNRFVPNLGYNDTFKILTSGKKMALGSIISIFSWSIETLVIYLGFIAAGFDFGFLETTQMFFTAALFGGITLLPGGVGATEGSLIGFLMEEGLEISQSTSLTIFVRLTTIWFATIVGFIAANLLLRKQ